MKPGDTFLIPDAIATHLNCVLAVLEDGSLLMCHFTTRRKRSDATCVIKKGEHSACTNDETVVRFDQVHICPAGAGVEALKRLITKTYEPLSAELLARVRKGALDSPQTPDKYKTLLKKI